MKILDLGGLRQSAFPPAATPRECPIRHRLAHPLFLLVGLALGVGTVGAQEPQLVVKAVEFDGNRAIDDLRLAASIATTASLKVPILGLFGALSEKRYLSEEEFRRDVFRLRILYRQYGYPEAQVDTVVQRTATDARVRFVIREGEPVRLQEFSVTGLDSLPERERREVLVDLPVAAGRPFNRLLLQQAVDTIVARLRDRGFAAADVFRDFQTDVKSRAARASLEVVTGPRQVVSRIRVEATGDVDTALARSLVFVQPGRRFSERSVYASQRNLYRADLYRFALVGIDSAGFDPAAGEVPLLLLVSQAPRNRVRLGGGYGTNDCFRLQAGWTHRNFLRSGNILDLSGRASKIGVGEPTDLGLENSVCGPLREDSIGSGKLNYNLTAAVRRPGVLGPTNITTVSAFGEVRSEFTVYRREEIGASLRFQWEQATRSIPVTLLYTFSYGRTLAASPAAYCSFFGACTPALRAGFEQNRVLATLGATFALPRANSPVDPSRGFNGQFGVVHSAPYLGSSDVFDFTRLSADAAWYRPVGRAAVLSWRLRGGIIFAPERTAQADESFVPLEQRFYAGGPSDVRGLVRAQLGPVVYVVSRDSFDVIPPDSLPDRQSAVQVSPTGGDATLVGNLEARIPTPLLGGRIGLAAFVDAGTAVTRGVQDLWGTIRVTPGLGLRFVTPLGPARVEVAYSTSDLFPGELYVQEPDGSLTLAQANFVRKRGSPFQFNISVGQPF